MSSDPKGARAERSLQVEREALDGCYGVKAMDVVNQEDQEIKGLTGNLVVHTLLMISEAP